MASTRHSPTIELAALRRDLRALDEVCVHWDYEDENPDCEHAEHRDAINRRIAVLRAQTNGRRG